MKTNRFIIILLFVLAHFSLSAQEEDIYNHFAGHREWNTGYVKDIVLDTDLVVNAIIIQAYTDEDWDSLLVEFGAHFTKSNDNHDMHNVLFGLSLRNNLKQKYNIEKTKGEPIAEHFFTYYNKTAVIYFPRNIEQCDEIFKLFLTKNKKNLSYHP